jgi:hypothetical protein
MFYHLFNLKLFTFAKPTKVISFPYLSIFPFPIGNKKSISISSSVTSKNSPYIISFSRKTTGFGFLIAALSNPLASLAL